MPRATSILPLHPRTRNKLTTLAPKLLAHCASLITLIDPLGYLDMVLLEKNAAVIITDSGGIQKEAFFHALPCVTLREETEWVELVEMGWNRLAPPKTTDIASIVLEVAGIQGAPGFPHGDGKAARKIVEILLNENNV